MSAELGCVLENGMRVLAIGLVALLACSCNSAASKAEKEKLREAETKRVDATKVFEEHWNKGVVKSAAQRFELKGPMAPDEAKEQWMKPRRRYITPVPDANAAGPNTENYSWADFARQYRAGDELYFFTAAPSRPLGGMEGYVIIRDGKVKAAVLTGVG
jgi:hypothetical protein